MCIRDRIDTNRIPYTFNKINIKDYFDDCIEEVGLDLESKNIELSYFNYADADTIVIADAEQLKRVINNIISNSVKYMDKPKGYINIRVKDVGDFIQVEICLLYTSQAPINWAASAIMSGWIRIEMVFRIRMKKELRESR